MAALAVVLASLAVPSGAASENAITFEHHISGTPGTNGWYTSNVGLYWTFNPQPSQTQGCDAQTITTEGTTQFDCQAWWGSTHLDDPVTINIDKTPPVVHGVPSRPPDANGWYDKPVTVSFSGTDGTSGIASCSSAPYGGPDSASAAVSGTCSDNAGNVGSATYSFPYDATPPMLGKVTLAHGNRSVDLRWTASADTQLTEVTRSSEGKGAKTTTVYRGAGNAYRDKGLRVGAKYRYTVTAFDPAANSATKTLAVTATGPLVNPVPGERVTSPPRLAWTPVKGASYYNVQLVRGGRVLSAWPTHPWLKLQLSWVYKGRRHRLRHGVYRWYVWPGFGLFAQAHFGRLLGGSSFVVSR